MKKHTLIIIACLVAFNIAEAQITRQQADAIVIQCYDSIINQIDIYSYPTPLSNTDDIVLSSLETISKPYQNCYSYFIDLLPFANWDHPCQYCFVNTSNGDISIIEENEPPFLWEDYSILIQRQRPSPSAYDFPIDTIVQRELPEVNPHLWAVLICADVEGNNIRYWGDLSCVYTTLTNVYGFQENTLESENETNSHILVYAPSSVSELDSDLNHSHVDWVSIYPYGNKDFMSDYEPYDSYGRDALRRAFRSFEPNGSRALGPEDKLFIYVTGHGGFGQGQSYFQMLHIDNHGNLINDIIHSRTFSDMLRNINCSQMTLLMQNCCSGGFIEDFMQVEDCACKNRTAFTATTSTGVSWSELHFTARGRQNDEDKANVNEFTYYWTAASLGYYPRFNFDFSHPENMIGPWDAPGFGRVGGNDVDWESLFTPQDNPSEFDINPDTDHDDSFSLKEIFTFAGNMDSWNALSGFYHPYVFLDYTESYQVFLQKGGDFPQSAYESSFTAEAATLRGYEGQVVLS